MMPLLSKSIKLKNLSFKYENSEITLNQINSEFNKGQIIGIVVKMELVKVL